MPNNAMITVTTADSKYSRQIVFGGPFGFVGTGGGALELPLRLKIREKVEGLVSVFDSVSPLSSVSVVKLLAIEKHPR
jgi:hypothetical protein